MRAVFTVDSNTLVNGKKMLMTWERKILRKIYGSTKENGQWRITKNEELITKYKAPDIVNVI
jgi:hypothetical protein